MNENLNDTSVVNTIVSRPVRILAASKRKKDLDDIFWDFFKIHSQIYMKLPSDPVLTRTMSRLLFQRGIEIGKTMATKERAAKKSTHGG